MATAPHRRRRRTPATRPLTAAAALSAATAAVLGSSLLAGASADVVAQPASVAPVSQPQVVLVQRVERPVVIRAARSSRLDAKGNDLVKVSALGSFDVPQAALDAYKRAAGATNASHPGCELPWTLLAAIGRVESDHGRYGGSVLGSDGVPRPAIRGVALNGVGPVAAIPDSDNGRFDGDKVWDRAVGPMQFIPTTWAGSGRDGDGDGVADPNDIDDAALAAAGYLCPSSGSIKAAGAMEQAVFSYNHSDYYVALVMAFEQGYRTGTFTIPSPPPPADEPEEERGKKKRDRRTDEPRKRGSRERGDEKRDDRKGERSDRERTKPGDEQPRREHRGGSGDSKGGSGSDEPSGSKPPRTPTRSKPPADETVTGKLAGADQTWSLGGRAVDLGVVPNGQSDHDYDGDKQQESYAAELAGLVALGEVEVTLKGGTVQVIAIQGYPWPS